MATTLGSAEAQFTQRAKSSGFARDLLSIPPTPSPTSSAHAPDNGTGGADPTYTFGYGGALPLSSATGSTAAADTLTSSFIPCTTPVGGVQLCGGLFATTELYTASALSWGLSASVVSVQGYAAAAAGEDTSVTLPASATSSASKITAELNTWTLNLSSSCSGCVGYGASPSYLYVDNPFGGGETQPMAGILDTLSFALPTLPDAQAAVSVAQSGYGALTTALDAIENPSGSAPARC